VDYLMNILDNSHWEIERFNCHYRQAHIVDNRHEFRSDAASTLKCEDVIRRTREALINI